MIIDFTSDVYRKLLVSLIDAGYSFYTFEQFIQNSNGLEKTIILRHDVDKKPKNSLKVALIEKELGVYGSYYFRIVKKSNKPDIIKKIANLGHEIGYHYEDLSLVNGDFSRAIRLFKKNLAYFRKFYPVKTICMHGSPLSKYNNILLLEKINLKDYDILGEPYKNLNFDKVFYLTDTSMRWNGSDVSVRDKVNSRFSYRFKSTFEIIEYINRGMFPKKVMINTHPQRWNDNFFTWNFEYFSQSFKNIIKRAIVKRTKF